MHSMKQAKFSSKESCGSDFDHYHNATKFFSSLQALPALYLVFSGMFQTLCENDYNESITELIYDRIINFIMLMYRWPYPFD